MTSQKKIKETIIEGQAWKCFHGKPVSAPHPNYAQLLHVTTYYSGFTDDIFWLFHKIIYLPRTNIRF
ncbi:hypothetical protein M5D96_001459, partial [Drosophila gunungcola]